MSNVTQNSKSFQSRGGRNDASVPVVGTRRLRMSDRELEECNPLRRTVLLCGVRHSEGYLVGPKPSAIVLLEPYQDGQSGNTASSAPPNQYL
jgi:hypothetical protein